jgi:deoxyribonuclease-4
MPLFGAHMSIAGGYHSAVFAAQQHGCVAVQLFTKNNNQWRGKDLTEADVDSFRGASKEAGIRIAMAHDSYLINLASPDAALYQRSVAAFVVELDRAERLGLHYLVMHPGSPGDENVEAGLRRVAEALDEAHSSSPTSRIQVLLETTAGQGYCLGHRFEHLARIIELVKEPNRLGVCFDTCHVFAAGYALAPEKKYHATLREFDRIVGLKKLRAFHINDSLKPLGSRVDRHAHIGKGCMGLEPFRFLVNDRRFRNHPMVLETPKVDGDNDDMDSVNLHVLRDLVRPRVSPISPQAPGRPRR